MLLCPSYGQFNLYEARFCRDCWCELVNGPMEAREADYGLAMTAKRVVIFSHWKIISSDARNEVTRIFLEELSLVARNSEAD